MHLICTKQVATQRKDTTLAICCSTNCNSCLKKVAAQILFMASGMSAVIFYGGRQVWSSVKKCKCCNRVTNHPIIIFDVSYMMGWSRTIVYTSEMDLYQAQVANCMVSMSNWWRGIQLGWESFWHFCSRVSHQNMQSLYSWYRCQEMQASWLPKSEVSCHIITHRRYKLLSNKSKVHERTE